MIMRDLGQLDGDVLLFGGVYSNRQAAQALRVYAQRTGIAVDHVICTGDVVAYCADPAGSVGLLRDWGCAVIAGNCEVQLATGAPDCGCGFETGTVCDRLSASWYGYAQGHMDAGALAWMAQLPDVICFSHHGKRYGVIHGGVTDVAQFIWETDGEAVFATQWAALEALAGPVDVVVSGHSGRAFHRQTGRGLWLNAGVIGMPPHDGAPQTRYAVLRAGEAEICKLEYDAAGAAAEMGEAGLPRDYREALVSGYWPSEDVLPAALRIAVCDRG